MFFQRCTRDSNCWPEPMGSLTFVIYFCICRPAIQAFQRMNYSTVEPPTLDSRNNGLSVIGTESHSNPKTRIVCIRKCSCIRKNGLSVIGTESHSNYTDYNQERQHQKLFLYQEQWLVSTRHWKPFKFYNQDRLHQVMFLQQCNRASICWPEPMGSLTFVIYFCFCRPANQVCHRAN